MPNWCMNELMVTGKGLKAFMKKAEGKEESTALSLESFFPMPKELRRYLSPPRRQGRESEKQFQRRLERLTEKYGAEDWYDWAIKNWGVKWDLQATILFQDETTAVYEFDSPWGPPLTAIERLSKLYPDLKFELFYFEPGMCFGGVATVQQGRVEEEHYSGQPAIDWIKEYAPELWEMFYGKEE